MGDGGSPLVGRERELAALDEALAALGRSTPAPILQIAGEPGIGKTRLLGEVQARADACGYVVLGGRAAEFEADLPFGVFVDAFDDYLAALRPERLAAVGPEWTPELATVFGAFVPLAGDRPPALQAERYRTYRAVRVLCEVLSRPRPVVVALDDVHWADPASVELLSYLLAHPPAGRVLVVTAFRPVPTPARLVAALAAAVRDGRAQRLDLGPLSRGEADRLTGGRLDADTRATLYQESGGNPFYLEQLARTVAEPVHAPFLALSSGQSTVPTPVATALASERDALSGPARTLLEAAAVVGDPFDADLAAEVAEVPPDQSLELVDTLVRSDLVRPTTVPRRFRFRHPIVRRAVYESTGAGWRIGAHARAAAALAAADTPAAALAHHLERSARPGDEAAIGTLIDAAQATNPRAPASAAHWYGVAMRLLGEDDPRTLELLVARATALGAAGQLEESHVAVETALGRLPPDAGQLRVQLTAFAAGVEMLMGHSSRARRRLVSALDALADRRSVEAASLQVELGVLALYASEWPHVRAAAEEALEISGRLGHKPLQAVAVALRAYAAASLGDRDAFQLVADAGTLFDRLGDEEVARRLDTAVYLGWADALLEHYADATRHLERAVAVSRATGQGQFLAPLFLGQLVSPIFQGRIHEAARLTDAAVETSRLGSPTNLLAWALFQEAWVSTYAGDFDRALRTGLEAKALLRNVEVTVINTAAGLFLGLAFLEAGQPRRARQELVDAVETPQIPRHGGTLLYETLTRTEIALGDVEAADGWALRAETSLPSGALPLETALAWRARAAVLLARARADEAAEMALAATKSAQQVGADGEAARARILAGRALSKAGHRDRAVAELDTAVTALSACGATGFAEEAAAELHRLGRRGAASRPPCAEPETGTLTAREREIAEFVAAGQTNRQIAAACYLSEKTVEGHLSRIFAKCGVSGRAALATLLSRRGWDGRH